jgi:hypothetical protein
MLHVPELNKCAGREIPAVLSGAIHASKSRVSLITTINNLLKLGKCSSKQKPLKPGV